MTNKPKTLEDELLISLNKMFKRNGQPGFQHYHKELAKAIRKWVIERLPEPMDGENWESDNYDAGHNACRNMMKERIEK